MGKWGKEQKGEAVNVQIQHFGVLAIAESLKGFAISAFAHLPPPNPFVFSRVRHS
jgi:hypothetical protein